MSIITSIPPIIMPARRLVVSPRRMPFIIDPSCVLALVPETIGNKWSDISGNGNHGVVIGATRTAKGRLRPAFSFDGFDDVIALDPSLYPVFSQISICLWINFNNLSGFQYIFDLETPRIVIFKSAVTPDELTISLTGLEVETSGILLSTRNGSFLNVIITANDLSNESFIYIDSIQKGSSVSAFDISAIPSGRTTIGARFDSVTSLDGLMDEVLIFNRVLTQNEITALYEWGRP